MKRLTLVVLALAVLASRGVVAQDPARLLKAAMNTELVDGDPKAAIEQYKKVAASGDRALAAQALLRMAGCYQKLGDAEAQRILAQIVRDYSDQAAVVAEARGKMVAPGGAGTRPTTQTTSVAWTLPPDGWVTGPVSADGGMVAYANWGNNNFELVIHDLVAGADRVVAIAQPGEGAFFPRGTAFSRDGQRLAYQAGFYATSGMWQVQVRVIDLRQPGIPQPRVLTETDTTPYDWTPDGKWIAVRQTKDQVTQQIGLLSTENGSLRVLKTAGWLRGDPIGFLSPDGRQLAAEISEDAFGNRDIIVLDVDGGSEVRAVEFKGDDGLMGWSPDGSSLLFTSARAGSLGLWSQRLGAGRTQGPPELIRPGSGPYGSLSLTPSGKLYLNAVNVQGFSVKESEFNFSTGEFISAPKDVSDTFVRSNQAPRWSPDGRLLAYVSSRGHGGGRVLVIRTVATGETRELPLEFAFRNRNAQLWVWMPDSRSIMAVGEDADKRFGFHRIDIISGQVSPVVLSAGIVRPEWSADGRTLYYDRVTDPVAPGQSVSIVRVARDPVSGAEAQIGPVIPGGMPVRRSPDGLRTYEARAISGGRSIVEHDTASGTEREMLRLFGDYDDWHLTPDGRSIVAATTDLATNEGLVVLCSIREGSVKNIFRAGRGQQVGIVLVGPDGQSVLIRQPPGRVGPKVPITYSWVPLDGRQPGQLEELAGLDVVGGSQRDSTFELRPDGRGLAFQILSREAIPSQVFVLENFLSKPTGGLGGKRGR